MIMVGFKFQFVCYPGSLLHSAQRFRFQVPQRSTLEDGGACGVALISEAAPGTFKFVKESE